MIALDDVSLDRGGSAVLVDVTFAVDSGEAVAVMGPNGAGKTSLLRLVAGFAEPDAGRVDVEGTVGFAPEDPQAGLFAATVAEEVAFFPRNRGLDVPSAVDAALGALDIEDLRDREPYSLSVGEQRRVSIAAVLAGDPDVLLLDEPTRGLDGAGQAALAALLADLEVTVLLATHDADFALGVADRVAVLADGEGRRVGEAPAVLGDEPFLEAAGIRPPGVVSWARRRGLDPPPADLAEAVERLEATP